MKTYKRVIELYADKKYVGSSVRFKRCKDYIEAMQGKKEVYVAGQGMVDIENKKLTAFFAK